jgi:hypothetical protein
MDVVMETKLQDSNVTLHNSISLSLDSHSASLGTLVNVFQKITDPRDSRVVRYDFHGMLSWFFPDFWPNFRTWPTLSVGRNDIGAFRGLWQARRGWAG